MSLTPEEKIQQARQQMLIDYRTTFNSETGARVLKDLEEFCGYNHPCFSEGQPDLTTFMLGYRNVFLRIKKFLELDPEKIKQQEAQSDG